MGIRSWLQKCMGRAGTAQDAPVTAVERGQWEEQSQEGEFDFHARNEWRQTGDFMDQTRKIFGQFGLKPDAYHGKVIMDLGAGSKLRTAFFENATLIALEPLADRFLKEIEWCDLRNAAEVYSVAAEDRVSECVGRADLLVSINVLDHCFDFDQVVSNIRDYLKSDGRAFLSFDKHDVADKMHPLELTEEVCERVFAKHGLTIESCTQGFGGVLGDTTTYGHGPYCLNYWLTPSSV